MDGPLIAARRLRIAGIVQSVGFRPFVARLAASHRLGGWVSNTNHGVEVHVEGSAEALHAFATALVRDAPSAARIDHVDSAETAPAGIREFRIAASQRQYQPAAGISPDLPMCDACLVELRDPGGRRFEYPYISCADCGPRYSIIRALPYDRVRTTMSDWPLCAACEQEYDDPADRRCHVEALACATCGPRYRLIDGTTGRAIEGAAVTLAAEWLWRGLLLAVKGVGGYHLCCDATNASAVEQLRQRKFRKSRPFAMMVRDLDVAGQLVDLSPAHIALLESPERPIVLAPARVTLPGLAPDNQDLGVMLPYAPIHHLLFSAAAPIALVMTSANRSSEPIAFDDGEARSRLSGIADGFLVGDRAIARRIDDSVVRPDADGPIVLRRARGYAPGVVARLPVARPILALGADLKNAITLVVNGAAISSQHIGDLEHAGAYESFRETIADLTAMHGVAQDELFIAHDAHPTFASTLFAMEFDCRQRLAVQHHRAHIASVLAERGAFDTRVVGVAFDGTGYGDDGTICGGEFFVGSLAGGLTRAAWLRPFPLPGGDAAARHPLSAAAGVLSTITDLPDLAAPPFSFAKRYHHARALVETGVRTFTATSAGRLFDTAAALLGFAGGNDYEGHAAVWLEQLALRGSRTTTTLPYELTGTSLDFRPTLVAIMEQRIAGFDTSDIARRFHQAVAAGTAEMSRQLCEQHSIDIVAVSGGVFQNRLLVDHLRTCLPPGVKLWLNHKVPPNDGGTSLGQAAMAAVQITRRAP